MNAVDQNLVHNGGIRRQVEQLILDTVRDYFSVGDVFVSYDICRHIGLPVNTPGVSQVLNKARKRGDIEIHEVKRSSSHGYRYNRYRVMRTDWEVSIAERAAPYKAGELPVETYEALEEMIAAAVPAAEPEVRPFDYIRERIRAIILEAFEQNGEFTLLEMCDLMGPGFRRNSVYRALAQLVKDGVLVGAGRVRARGKSTNRYCVVTAEVRESRYTALRKDDEAKPESTSEPEETPIAEPVAETPAEEEPIVIETPTPAETPAPIEPPAAPQSDPLESLKRICQAAEKIQAAVGCAIGRLEEAPTKEQVLAAASYADLLAELARRAPATA